MKITVKRLTTRPGKGGKLRYFWQPSKTLQAHGWKIVRLSDELATACREADVWNAKVEDWRLGGEMAGDKDTAVTTLGDVIRAYQRHRYFLDRRESTRRGYSHLCAQLEEWAGDRPIVAITPADIDTLFTQVRRRAPTLANHLLIMLRTIYKFAALIGAAKENPAKTVRQAKVEVENRIWSRRAIEAFVAAADAADRHSVGTAVLLNSWIGQRQGDVLALAQWRIEDGKLSIRQSKTGARVKLPIAQVPQLVSRLEAEAARQAHRLQQRAAAAGVSLSPHATRATHLITSEETGAAYKADNFRHVFARIRSTAAAAARTAGDDALAEELEALDFLHLRHTAVTEQYLAGSINAEIAAITGHSLAAVEQILDRYFVRTEQLAEQAFARRVEKEGKK